MRRWKKILLVLFAVLLLAQIPFIYNRFQTGRLSRKIISLEAARTEFSHLDHNEFKGVIHAHTNLGGHSTGGFDELLRGARGNDLDFVVMTEHTSENYDTAKLTLNGFYGKTLFIGGNELSTNDGNRFLLIDGSAEAHQANKQSAYEFLQYARAENKLAFVTYPEKFKAWDAGFDGIEVFSLHTNAKRMNPVSFIFDALWSYGKYPELTLARYFSRPDANLKKFDELAARRKITLFAGSDAHSNIGFHLFGDDTGNKLINLKFDDYETIFRAVRTHVLIEKDKPLTAENLIDALRKGNCFIAFDVLSEADGFSFSAENGSERAIQGDEIALNGGVKLTLKAPLAARFAIFKNGEKIFESQETHEVIQEIKEPGTYRVEAYLDRIGSPFDEMPWIISNPIYVR